jgi:hypothetical protein
MSKQAIGPREQALRDMREKMIVPARRPEIAAALPKTSGVRPVKRKAKKRSKR